MSWRRRSRLKEFIQSFTAFWHEFFRFKSGVVGLVITIVLVIMAIGAPFFVSEEAYRNWDNPSYWDTYPHAVPPAWIGYVTGERYAPQTEVVKDIPPLPTQIVSFSFLYNCTYDHPPSDVIFLIESTHRNFSCSLKLRVERPDGEEIVVLHRKYDGGLLRILFSTDEDIRKSVWEWAQKYEDPETVSKILANPEMLSFIDIPHIVFMKKGYGMLFERTGVLEGTYVFNITMIFSEIPTPPPGFHVKAVFTGAAYGLMGTDARGRDLAVGIVFGSRLALIIGLLTAVLSTVVGVLYGIVSAYLGGWRDELLQRIQETVSSIPVLPLLIILAFVMRPTVWILALLLVVFGWVGPVKTVRSIAYQIKEETYVEAARAVGCSSRRIIAKYISPQILPYMFALIALGVPGAILTEAGISFLLGVEGVSEPTWGRILHDAQAAGATMAGMWWWVLIPGFMITLSGLAFVLIGNALDRILNPMLKR